MKAATMVGLGGGNALGNGHFENLGDSGLAENSQQTDTSTDVDIDDKKSKSPLVQRFGELTRKIWHAKNFKGQVSPHEFLQAVMKASNKHLKKGSQSDPVEFMCWILNKLHEKLKSSKRKHSIIHECYQLMRLFLGEPVWTPCNRPQDNHPSRMC